MLPRLDPSGRASVPGDKVIVMQMTTITAAFRLMRQGRDSIVMAMRNELSLLLMNVSIVQVISYDKQVCLGQLF
jgi:hypothetical protein